MNLIKTFFLFFSVVNSQLLGANNDPSGNGCVTDGGYEWCKETNSCVRSWETSCPSLNYIMEPGPVIDPIYPVDPLPVMKIPDNCATWYDGCNTCSVHNGALLGCTLMMCFRTEQPYCQAFHTGRLNGNDVCYQFCEDNSQPPINRIDDCPKHTRCVSRFTQNQVSMIAYDTCGERAKHCILIGGH